MPSRKKKISRHEYKETQRSAQIEGNVTKLPQKKFYRQRAHANPFSDYALKYPLSPAHMDWASHYPAFVDPNIANTTLVGTRKLLKDVEIADIGCGFGGLLIGLAPILPDTLMIGMEIRAQVVEYVKVRISALRNQQQRLRTASSSATTHKADVDTTKIDSTNANASANVGEEKELPEGAPALPDSRQKATNLIPGGYQNISSIRSNTMKFLPRFFHHHQLSKIFICFPDPHFKNKKHRHRIISSSLNAEYAFVLKPGGLLYTITDVEEYHYWILRHFGVYNSQDKDTTSTSIEENSPAAAPVSREESDAKDDENINPSGTDNEAEEDEDEFSGVARVKELFERVSDEELARDECVRVMREETEEGRKVARNNGPKFVAVFRRLSDPDWSMSL